MYPRQFFIPSLTTSLTLVSQPFCNSVTEIYVTRHMMGDNGGEGNRRRMRFGEEGSKKVTGNRFDWWRKEEGRGESRRSEVQRQSKGGTFGTECKNITNRQVLRSTLCNRVVGVLVWTSIHDRGKTSTTFARIPSTSVTGFQCIGTPPSPCYYRVPKKR